MDPKFDYNSFSTEFVHCLNHECKRADECLRRQMALRMPAERETVTVVNLAHITPSGEDCSYFKADQTKTFARGISYLLDQLPHNKAVIIKSQLLNHFGRSLYYRFWRKEYLISPSQQEYIRQTFRKNGVKEAPVFDEYEEAYE